MEKVVEQHFGEENPSDILKALNNVRQEVEFILRKEEVKTLPPELIQNLVLVYTSLGGDIS